MQNLGPGHGNGCISVGWYTLNEGNKRGDWMKRWLMLQGYTPLNTMYRKTPQKHIHVSKKKRKIDYILTKRRYLRHAKDAEANDTIHMGSDHRCVMAIFTITSRIQESTTRLNMMNVNKQNKTLKP